jgi:DNA polymerase-3 subunit delta
MRLRPEQLDKQLAQGLAPVYLISGDETLLVQESADTIRAAARKHGFSERQLFHVEGNFDWSGIANELSALSLFTERKLLDLRIPSGKPGDAGGKLLEAFCHDPAPDIVLLIQCNKLDGSTTRARWYKAIEEKGITVPVWPIDTAQLPRWIEQRLRAAKLSATPDAIELLADRVQGNLLAAAQEIEKLKLYSDGNAPIDAELVAQAVADNARFDPFGLADQALSGNTAACLRALAGLRGEGVEPPVILWVLAKELRALYRCAEQIDQGLSVERAMSAAGVWEKRKPLMQMALQRVSMKQAAALLVLCNRIDAAIKGSGDDPWQLLDQLVLGIGRAG